MRRLTTQGQQIIEDLAQRYGVSTDAVMTLLQAVVDGNGTMAQFSHPEFGGSGQWMQGGMTMVGDMFNYALKSKVDGLCAELSNVLANQPIILKPERHSRQGQQQQDTHDPAVSLFVSPTNSLSSHWWPAELSEPSSTGSQNNIRYAYFPVVRRLAVEINGHVTVYDTLDHQISGVSQQQSADASLTFTSQYGLVRVANLPVISVDGVSPLKTSAASGREVGESASADEVAQESIFAKIERLAELRQKNIISQEEFDTKKAELLGRL